MDDTAFLSVLRNFEAADVDQKINLYMFTEGLSQEQYRQMLKRLPAGALSKLEEAMG